MGNKEPLIIDVGANVGMFALWALERWKGSRLHLGATPRLIHIVSMILTLFDASAQDLHRTVATNCQKIAGKSQ